MQCSDPASEVVPGGHFEHFVMFKVLKAPGIQEQLSEPAMDVESNGQDIQDDISEVLYVLKGHKLQEPLLLSFQVHSVPEGQLQVVP